VRVKKISLRTPCQEEIFHPAARCHRKGAGLENIVFHCIGTLGS
jgi:hypothetical protein